MATLSQRTAALKSRLSDLEPWARIAILAALALLLWTGFQGSRFVTATMELSPVENRIAEIEEETKQRIPEKETLLADLESARALFDRWKSTFSYDGYPRTDSLVFIIANSAIEAGIDVKQVRFEPATRPFVTLGGINYQTQEVDLLLESEVSEDYNVFLFLLSKKVPSLEIEEVVLAGFDEEPFAQMKLLFYLGAEPVKPKSKPPKEPDEEPEKG